MTLATTPNWAEAVSAIASAVMAVTAVGGVVYAGYNLKAWLREKRGDDEYATAKKILALVYGVRDSIWVYRIAATLGNDGQEQMQSVEGAFIRLQLVVRDAEVLFGGSLTTEMTNLWRCLVSLKGSHAERSKMRDDESYFEELGEGGREWIWDVTGYPGGFETIGTTAFWKSVEAAVRQFESALRPKLRA